MLTNFFQETLRTLTGYGQTPKTIKFIGSKNGEWGCSWSEFEKVANFAYNDGYGTAEIPSDLVIVFVDGSWLSRGEYDGSEWWTMNRVPATSSSYKVITNLDYRKNSKSWETSVENFQSTKDEEY